MGEDEHARERHQPAREAIGAQRLDLAAAAQKRTQCDAGGMQAPHVNISVFARGVLNRLATRLYFDGDPALGEDPVLKRIEPARRATLLAKRDAKGLWRLPIHLGGPNETVFFDA